MTAQKTYSWNPADYAKNSTNQYAWAKELIPKLGLCGNESLLDIGCGDGKVTAEIARCLPDGSVVGVDNSPEMVKLAQSTFPAEQYPNLHFEVMDARNLTFDNQFDIAFSNATLHWILDQKAALAGVKRSLKPHGRVLFQMAGKRNAADVLAILGEMLHEPTWSGFFEGFRFPYAFLDAEEYRGLLLEAGLVPLRVETFPRDMKFSSAEGMAGWVRTTWLPFTERVPPELRCEFVGGIVDRYFSRYPPDDGGVVHLGMVRLEVEAKKD